MKPGSLTLSSKLTIVTLLAMFVFHLLSTIILNGEFSPFALVIELPLIIVALLVATGRWWATLLAAGLSGLLFLMTLAGSMERLADPGNPEFFVIVVFLALALITVAAGLWATAQGYRNRSFA